MLSHHAFRPLFLLATKEDEVGKIGIRYIRLLLPSLIHHIDSCIEQIHAGFAKSTVLSIVQESFKSILLLLTNLVDDRQSNIILYLYLIHF